jgi:hypothetical protein
MNKRCNNCEVLIQTKHKDRMLWFCEGCHETIKHQSKRHELAKRKFTQLTKLERGCEAEGGCDYTQQGQHLSHYMFDYDHIDPSLKTKEISTMCTSGRWSFDDIKKEIAKCRVLCKMHHALVTEKQWLNRKNSKVAVLANA